jgi:hypothetical protein
MRKARRVHVTPIQQKPAKLLKPSLGEEGARPSFGVADLDQPPIHHGAHRRRDFRLVLLQAAAPGAQENTVRQARILAEVPLGDI